MRMKSRSMKPLSTKDISSIVAASLRPRDLPGFFLGQLRKGGFESAVIYARFPSGERFAVSSLPVTAAVSKQLEDAVATALEWNDQPVSETKE